MVLPLLLMTQLLTAPIIADYDSELRQGDRVDQQAMIDRLTELGVDTYFWLVWHSPHDWEDLQTFLPLARDAGLKVWVYLVPHSETALQNPRWPYSEPFKLDYVRWATEIGRLSKRYDNLVGYVIDDFWTNVSPQRFSLEYIRTMVAAGRAENPKLKFYPLMYYRQLGVRFMTTVAPLVDGVVAAYPRDRAEIEEALSYLNDTFSLPSSVTISYPWDASNRGDHGFVTQLAEVTDAARATVKFRYLDDFDGPTAGYHLLQLRVGGQVVWSEDCAGRDRGEVTVDLAEAVKGQTKIELKLGVYDAKGVGHFGVAATFAALEPTGLKLAQPELSDATGWVAETTGKFTVERLAAQRGEGKRRLPLLVMTAAQQVEYAHRHGTEGTPDEIAAQFKLALDVADEGLTEGVVTYCLNKGEGSAYFEAVKQVIQAYRQRSGQTGRRTR